MPGFVASSNSAVRLSVALLVVAFLLGASICAAQTGSATLSGTVTDQTGAVVTGAEVRLTNADTNVSVTTETNRTGIYVLPGLKPGRYRLTVMKLGFKQIVLTDMVLNVQDSVSCNFTLEQGATSEAASFNAAGAILTTDVSSVNMIVPRDFMASMPLNGRSFQDLISLAPGMVQNGAQFVVNGIGYWGDTSYYMVDGVSSSYGGLSSPSSFNLNVGAYDWHAGGTYPALTVLFTTQSLASVDTVQEFRVQTAAFNAEFGRMAGSQIQITTRSGTNDWHGAAFEYLRNEAMDANDWFSNLQGIPRRRERQNDFGGTLGGPVVLPGIYSGKGRTFFFVSAESLRLELPQLMDQAVPTVEVRRSAPPELQPFLNAFPLPNSDPWPGYHFGRLTQGYSDPSSFDALSIRLDHGIGNGNQVFLRVANTPSLSSYRSGSVLSRIRDRNRQITLGATAKLKANVSGELRLNYSRDTQTSTQGLDSFGGAIPFAPELLLPPEYAPPGTSASAYIDVGSWSGLSFGRNMFEHRQGNVVGNLSWLAGRHALKVGADIRRLSSAYGSPEYQVRLSLQLPTTVYFPTVGEGGGSVPASYSPAVSVGISSNGRFRPTFENISLYVQDHWKATPRFTLEYGLRWEINPAPGASNGIFPPALSRVDSNEVKFAPVGTSLYGTTFRNFAPRMGFAYQINNSALHSVVLRGGSGLFYDLGQEYLLRGYDVFQAQKGIMRPALPLSLETLAPPPLDLKSPPPFNTVTVIDPNLKLPRTAEFNLSLDTGLAARNTLTVSGVGNISRQGIRFPVFTGPGTNLIKNGTNSHYSALQVTDRGYLANGLQLLASWTWARALDNSYPFGYPQANSYFDVRHTFNAALNYRVPGLRGTGWTRSLTHDWLFAGRFVAQTGYPFNILLLDGSFPFVNPNVPIFLHDRPGVPGGLQLNRAAFSVTQSSPSQYRLGHNFLHGPGFWNLNAALDRSFRIRSDWRLHCRVEAFNVFNHPNFYYFGSYLADSDTVIQVPDFGQAWWLQTFGVPNKLHATGAARSLQVSLRLQF